jgi:hypothetical protein
MADAKRFAEDVLHGLGIKPSKGALRAMDAWIRAEGGHTNGARFNWLNTTMPAPGAGNTGTQGNIKVYRSYEQGVEATVKTLKLGFYDGIRHALKKGDAMGAVKAVESSPWGTGGLAVKVLGGTPARAPVKADSGPSSRKTLSEKGKATPAAEAHPGLVVRPDTTGDRVEAAMALLHHKSSALGFAQQIKGIEAQADANAVTIPGAQPETPEAPKPRRHSVRQHPGSADTSAKGTANFEGHTVAAWIKPALEYARKHGWKGQVNSGFRTYAKQKEIYDSGVRPAARPGTSNHEGADFPRGAVDVTDAEHLSAILRKSPYAKKLQWAGAKDPVHFSHPHNGSY